MIQQAFGDQCLSRAQMFQWYAQFMTGRTSVDDDEHAGRRRSCTTPETVARIQELVRKDRRQTIHNIAGGGNWLWDVPAGSDGRMANAPCRSLHHDNASSDTSVFTHQLLAKNQMAVIPHPTYSPDLAPCDFFLFPKMKLKPKGRWFDTIEEIQVKSESA